MAHDKVKAATRKRMAETGEPYSVARRAVIEEHKQATERATKAASLLPDATPVEPADEVRMMPMATGAERATLDAIASAVEQAAKLSASVPKWTSAERAAIADIARAVEQTRRFSALDRAALDGIASAVEQVERINDTIRGLSWV